MNLGVRVSGGEIAINFDRAFEKAGKIVEDYARSLAPEGVPIKTDTKDLSVSVYADTPYGESLEFGTPKMAPQPFLVPSLIAAEDEIIDTIACEMEIL